jgi:4-hydroxy-tetrahydrodipicolinate synthase
MATYKRITGGTIAAAVTPRQSREHSIDLAATLELIDFLHEGGADCIALLTSAGEFIHFMMEDRARMLDFAVKRSRLPVLVNISHSTCDGAVYLGQEAAGSGVAAVVLMPPYYFRYTPATIRAFYLSVAEELAKEVPIFLSGVPADLANELIHTGLFEGVEEATGDWNAILALLEARGDRPYRILSGADPMAASARAAGCDGVISPIASAVPELMARLQRAVAAGERDRAHRLNALLQELHGRLSCFPAPVGIKEAARQRRVHVGAHATPLGSDEQRDLKAFGAWFKEWLPGVLKECR